MSAAAQPDYTALAAQFGGTPVAAPSQSGTDYTALAKQFGGTPAGSDTQDQTTEQPGFWHSLGSSIMDHLGTVIGGAAAPIPMMAAGFGSSDAYANSPEGQADADANRRRIHAHALAAGQAFSNGNYLDAARHVQDAFLGDTGTVQQIEHQIGNKDYGGAAGTGLGKAIQGLLAYGTAKAGVKVGKANLPGKAISAVTGGGDPITLMVQGVKPRANVLKFSQNLADSGLGDAKMGEAAIGKPVGSVDDALAAVQKAKELNRQAYAPFGGPDRGQLPVDLSATADAMDNSIPATLAHEAQQGVPAASAELAARRAQSQAYRTIVPLSKAEAMLRDANAELDAFYAKYPRAQWATLQTNPETAATYAKAQALRNAVYSSLDNYGVGDAAREINKRYGNLLELEEELQRRKNVAARQQPQSLSEQVGKVRGYGQAALGAAKVLTGAAPASGLVDIAGGLAQGKIASWLKEQQTTNALVSKAFKNYAGTPRSFPQYSPPNIKGLLTAGPLVTPSPSDASFVRGVQGMNQPPNPARALPPASTIFQGGTPDTSGPGALPGNPGGMRVGFPQKALPPASNPPLNTEIGSQHGDLTGHPSPRPPVNPYRQ